MPLAGRFGSVELSREWPKPIVFPGSALQASPSGVGTLDIAASGFWIGDRVVLTTEFGSPGDLNGDGFADSVNGFGFYGGSTYQLGIRRSYLINDNSNFYTASDNNRIYDVVEDGVLTLSGYLGRDQLDRVKLYSDESGAHLGDPQNELALYSVFTGDMLLTPYSDTTGFISSLPELLERVRNAQPITQERFVDSKILLPEAITTAYNSLSSASWNFVASTESWSIELSSSKLDMTAIGECFGQYTKAVAEGAGTMRFLIEPKWKANTYGVEALLHLVLMTQQEGSKAKSRFYVYNDPPEHEDGTQYKSLAYVCSTLLSNVNLTVEAPDLIRGTADFVIIGKPKIELRTPSV